MLKKLIAFAIGSAISMSASAGYVQYQLSGSFDTGDGLSGFFVQDSDTRAIAYYNLQTSGSDGAQYFASGIFSNLTAASTNFQGSGPTSFHVYSYLNDAYYSDLDLTFRWDPAAHGIGVQGWETANPLIAGLTGGLRILVDGHVAQVAIDPNLAAALAAGQTDGINNIIPRPLPEPSGIALLLAGGVGLAGLRRRVKRA